MQRRDQVEVLLAALVVEQHLALDDGFDRLAIEHAFVRHRRSQLQNVVGRARVAVRVDRDLFQQTRAARRVPASSAPAPAA